MRLVGIFLLASVVVLNSLCSASAEDKAPAKTSAPPEAVAKWRQ